MVGTSIGFDTVLDLCQYERRRIVLSVLTDQQQPVTVTDLAETVVERDRRGPPTEAAAETLASVETSLNHVHLPRLVDAGLVEYSRERQLMEPTDQFVQGEPHLSAILDADPLLAMPSET